MLLLVCVKSFKSGIQTHYLLVKRNNCIRQQHILPLRFSFALCIIIISDTVFLRAVVLYRKLDTCCVSARDAPSCRCFTWEQPNDLGIKITLNPSHQHMVKCQFIPFRDVISLYNFTYIYFLSYHFLENKKSEYAISTLIPNIS